MSRCVVEVNVVSDEVSTTACPVLGWDQSCTEYFDSSVFANSWDRIVLFGLRYSEIFHEQRYSVFGIRKFFISEDLQSSVFGNFS